MWGWRWPRKNNPCTWQASKKKWSGPTTLKNGPGGETSGKNYQNKARSVRNPKQIWKDPLHRQEDAHVQIQTILLSCNHCFTNPFSSFLFNVYKYVHVPTAVYPLTAIFDVRTLLGTVHWIKYCTDTINHSQNSFALKSNKRLGGGYHV